MDKRRKKALTAKRKGSLTSRLAQVLPLALKDGILHSILTGEPLSCSVHAALVYTLQHPRCRVTLKETAKATGFPAQCMKKRFKKEMGIPISEFQLHERVGASVRRMVLGEEPPKSVASDEWAKDMAYQWRIIKKKTGMSPREIYENGQESFKPEARIWFRDLYTQYQEFMSELILGSSKQRSRAQSRKWEIKMNAEALKLKVYIETLARLRESHPEALYTPRGLARRGLSRSARVTSKRESHMPSKRK